jgi:Icc protein
MNWFRKALLLLPLASAGPGPAPQAAVRVEITGTVFVDQNANGLRDPGEPGLGNAVVSDQRGVVTTGVDGTFRLDRPGGRGIVYVSVPSGYRAVGQFWRTVDSTNAGPFLFALTPVPESPDFVFIHASDTHISPASLGRTRRLRALVDSIAPAFVLITGDLVRDALRVPEAEATGYYQLFQQEMALFRVPVWTVPGNHEIFGIERHHSLVSPAHPLYGRGMYRHYRGPDYYSFNHGGVHFVGLNTVDADDLWYYGHVDSTQAEWLSRDLAATPAAMPVVSFNHIPFFTSVETVNGYLDTPPAPTAITVRGKTSFRHAVANAGEIIARLTARPYDLALGGHMHVRETLRFEGIPIRFYQGAAVVGPSDGAGLAFASGVVVYRVTGGKIDDGTFVPLEP